MASTVQTELQGNHFFFLQRAVAGGGLHVWKASPIQRNEVWHHGLHSSFAPLQEWHAFSLMNTFLKVFFV